MRTIDVAKRAVTAQLLSPYVEPLAHMQVASMPDDPQAYAIGLQLGYAGTTVEGPKAQQRARGSRRRVPHERS